MTTAVIRLILASASPGRLRTLRQAGLSPEVVVSGIDESTVEADSVSTLVAELARLKAESVAARLAPGGSGGVPPGVETAPEEASTVLIGCDSMLELDGAALGKPASAAEAADRWRRMAGHSGVLHTGHHVIMRRGDDVQVRSAVAATTVRFATLTADEIDAYVATGEPLAVAGAFTVDGLGGAFVTGISGDHHNVVGISLPLLRVLLADLGVPWPTLWDRRG
jgi:septum formation protein